MKDSCQKEIVKSGRKKKTAQNCKRLNDHNVHLQWFPSSIFSEAWLEKIKLHTLPGITFAQVNKFLEIRVPGDVCGSKQTATFSSASYCWENLSVCDNKGIFSPHLHKPPQANFKYLEMAAFFRDLFLICSSLNLCEQLTGEDFMMKESCAPLRALTSVALRW